MHPCATCASIQKTCCQRAEIVLTAGDIQRIETYTARGRAAFVERRAPADPAYLEPDPDDPNWVRYTVAADGTRRVLRRRAGGDCTFLGEQGCVLPTEVRPLVCRLYPFMYNEERLDGVDQSYCPVSRLAPPGVTMLTVLGMDPADGERWRRDLYAELRAEASPALATPAQTRTALR